ncbi:breast cancer metastasis-suppressor 1-like protein isoform X2 [Gigantopelta aegis]|uniref:breast cancer metastasis-suppressor 1-like protein isoform X2 n=1 Tax=Gigantopelta aegis TaxID=1735272 RepID=UPI001B88DB85|nr:breast cancer metastasis-suppressor 1-like protein isoform X2 [Gigantopelta aegis]
MSNDKTPAMPENELTEEEDMEHETPDSDKSSDDETGTASSDDAESSSEIDEEECQNRKMECLDDMYELERQFSELKEHLYAERVCQMEAKLKEVIAGKASEYLNPLAQLQENMRTRTEVSGILKDLRIACIKNRFESEELGSYQHMESEKLLLYDSVKQELEEKIRRLEEDRHNIDISSDLWNESQTQKKKKKSTDPFSTDRRRKPVTIAGPYVIYMLKEIDIIEDWTDIKKALKQQAQRRKSEL